MNLELRTSNLEPNTKLNQPDKPDRGNRLKRRKGETKESYNFMDVPPSRQKSTILRKLGLQKELPTAYCLLTLHRPSNVDDKDAFLRIINALTEISKRIPIIFPIHPRTRKQIEAFGLGSYFVYHDFNSMNPTNLSREMRSLFHWDRTNQIDQINRRNSRNQTK